MKTSQVCLNLILIMICCLNVHPQTNLSDDPVKKLMDTDRKFSELSETMGANDAFLEFCHDSVVILRDNNYPYKGKDVIRQELFSESDTGYVLTWEPAYGFVAVSGDLGYTYGVYTYATKENKPLIHQGTYISVWRRDEGGSWKYVLDSGNQGLGDNE